MLCLATIAIAQDKQTTFSVEGDLVKATYYYDDGSTRMQGYFKDKKLTGEWVRFDKLGNKIQLGYYENGKKVGKWFIWRRESLKEINYQNNVIASVNTWKSESKIALNKSFLRNEGQYVSVKYISVYAHCHKRKLLILNSPLVLIKRSGSG